MRLAEYLKRQPIYTQDRPSNDFERAGTDFEEAEDLYKNLLHEMHYPSGIPSYGILVQEHFPGGWATIAIVSPLSRDPDAVALLIKKYSRLQIPPEQLWDVIHDFLAQEVLSS